MTIPDIRAGLPSASALGRLSKCAASWQLSRLAVRQGIGNNSNSASDSGNRIHAWLETHGADEWDALSDDERETATKCYAQAEQIIADWGAEIDGCLAEREKRLWLFADGRIASAAVLDAEPVFSGAADLIVHGDRRALVIDYKTGRGDYEPAADNPQLEALAVLVSGWTGADQIRVGLIQPWVSNKPSVADYDGPKLDVAKAWLLGLLKHIKEPDLVPNPGDHCKYCAARGGVCPATTNELVMLANPLDSPEAIEEFVEDLDGPKLGRILSVAKRAEWTIAAARTEARRRLEAADPGSPPGWTLREGARTREVTDLEESFARLAVDPVLNLTAEEMRGACSLSLPTLEQTVSKRSLIPKPKVATRIAEVLGPLVSYGRKAPSLVEQKPELTEAQS